MIEPSEYTFDLIQILFGEYSFLIYIEMVFRVLIIMTFTMFMIRWIGKRSVGGLGSADVLLIIAMGSAVGDAMLYPSVPLSFAILVITSIASLQKLYVYISIKFETVRHATHQTVVKLVEHGELKIENFEKDQIDRNEVFMLLRESGVRYLSEVEHAYFEQSGNLSVFRYSNPKLENSILPEDIKELDVAT